MATVAPASESTQTIESDAPDRIVLHGISWDLYELLRENKDNWHVRMAYDDGSLELMAPSQKHEEIEINFGHMLKTIASVLGLPFKPLAGTTWKIPGEMKAKEADGCFYLANYPRVRHKKIDLKVDPPPDLAIEVEVSRSALDTLTIYASIGVPEVWRYDGSTFHIHTLQTDKTYREVDQSLALPFLRIHEVVGWLDKAEELDNIVEWDEMIRQWARDVLVPRLG